MPDWSNITAVKKGQVALADGKKYFNRSGTAILHTLRIVAEILHGDQFEQRWRGKPWEDCHAQSRQDATGRIP